MSDFVVTIDSPQPTIFLLTPETEPARRWVEENLDPDAQWLGKAVAVEHRYIADIIIGIVADGLSVYARRI